MIADKNSRRSKGIAYVEFHDESSIQAALLQTGQKLFGVPIIVQPTMAEKNRLVQYPHQEAVVCVMECVCM